MKLFVVLALFALVAVSLAQPVDDQAPVAETKEATAAAAPEENKDLETANSYIYGGYPAYGAYAGYGGYGYGGGIGYGGYPAYYGGYNYLPYGGLYY